MSAKSRETTRPLASGRKRGPTPPSSIDREIGAKVRERRLLMGLSQQATADRIGVTHQQLNKYEVGQNRVSVGRLYTIAEALEVDIAHFFPQRSEEEGQPLSEAQRRMLELSRSFIAMSNRRYQELVGDLTRLLAETPAVPEGELEAEPVPEPEEQPARGIHAMA